MAIFIENGLAAASAGADEFLQNDLIVTGSVYWVDSEEGSDANSGTQGLPVATLAQAITLATANNGDLILIKSGHAETLTSPIVVSKAGLKIFGLGSASGAPNFTVNAAVDGFQVTAASVEINNLYFPVGTTATNTSRIKVDAANVKVKGCTFMCGQYDTNTVTVTANGLYASLENLSMTVSASGPASGIKILSASVVGTRVKDCAFNGGDANWSLGAIYSTVAHLNYCFDSITMTGNAIMSLSGGSKGVISNVIGGTSSQVVI